jgi:hypothetical protein
MSEVKYEGHKILEKNPGATEAMNTQKAILCIGDLKHLDGWFAGKFLQDILESCG